MKHIILKRIGRSFIVNILVFTLFMFCSDVPSEARVLASENVVVNNNSGFAVAGISAELSNILLAESDAITVSILEKDHLLVGSGEESTIEENTQEDVVLVEDTQQEELITEEAAEESEVSTIEIEGEILYDPVEEYTMYVGTSVLRERSEPDSSDNTNIVTRLDPGTEITVVGTRDDEWVAIESSINEDEITYVSGDYIQDTAPEEATYNWDWSGEILNKSNGRVAGPSGNETYYNMDMSYVVERLQNKGYEGSYWVRDDGVKMFGDYVMVAAAFDIRPIGTLLETTLGTGIVCDTGTYINWDHTGLDVAVSW